MHWPAPLQVQEDPDGGITRLISRAPRQPSGSSCVKQNTVPLEAVSPGAASSQEVLQRLKVNAEEIVDGERGVVKNSVSGVCVKLEPPQKRQTCYHCRYQIICALIGPVEGRQDGVRIITHVPLTPQQCSQLALPNHVARKIKCVRNRGAVLRAISPRRQPTYNHTLATERQRWNPNQGRPKFLPSGNRELGGQSGRRARSGNKTGIGPSIGKSTRSR